MTTTAKFLICLAVALLLTIIVWGFANAQTYVVDANGRYVGRYLPTGVQSNATENDSFGESVIRELSGVWVALPISPDGFSDTLDNSQSAFWGLVYWTAPNCQGTPYLQPTDDNTIGIPGDRRPGAPFVQNGLVVQGVVYFLDPGEYPFADTVTPLTVCSVGYVGSNPGFNCAPLGRGGACETLANLLGAHSFTLSTLGLTPPFSLR